VSNSVFEGISVRIARINGAGIMIINRKRVILASDVRYTDGTTASI
jgi:hypothetical protein